MVLIYAIVTGFLVAFSASTAPRLAAPGKCNLLFSPREHIERPENYATAPLREKGQLVTVSMNLNRFFVRQPDSKNLNIVQTSAAGIPAKSHQEIMATREVIDALSADVYAFQEVVGSYSTRALDPRGEYYHLTDSLTDVAGLQNVFMVRKTLDVDAKIIQPQSMNPLITPRGLAVLKIRAKDESGKIISPSQPDIMVMGVHLKSQRGLQEYEYNSIKARELNSVKEAYSEMQKKFPGTPFMIAGDLNVSVSRSNPMLAALSKNFRDSLDLTHPDLTPQERATKVSLVGEKIIFSQLDAAFISQELKEFVVDSFVYHHTSPLPRLKELLLEDGTTIPVTNENLLTLDDGTKIPVTHRNLLQLKDVSDHFPVVTVINLADQFVHH